MLIENKHIGYSCRKESFFVHNRAKNHLTVGLINKQKVKIKYMEMTQNSG